MLFRSGYSRFDFGSRILQLSGRMLPIAGLLGFAVCANAQSGHMPLGGTVSQPLGAELFCYQHANECTEQRSATQEVKMTPELWSQLLSVQHEINGKFKPTREVRFAWDYSSNGTGNCVQFALEKRRALIRRGLPPGALQLATAVIPANIGHLVLVIDTDEGDWVLDNLRSDVVRWEQLPYRWIARQQGASMEDWVAVGRRG
jgi:predicted transglutaminase-like cysteine proteinase